jgi:hypothetical protein
MAKRAYSTRFTPRGVPRTYLLSGIPPGLWDRARSQAKKDDVSMRTLILTLIEEWLAKPRPPVQE